MPDYYIAEDGTIHDREAEHRSRTQHTAAPAVADTTCLLYTSDAADD